MIVGLGQIGMGYDLSLNKDNYVHTHARAFSTHPDFDLVCGVDPIAERCEVFSSHFNCPAHPTIEDALADQSVDVVAIAVPTSKHMAALHKILELINPLAVLCEKPLGDSIENAQAMNEKCKDANVGLYVNYTRRSSPGVIDVKRMIDTGEITFPVRGITWYSKGFLHNGSHFFDLAEYWLGEFKEAQIVDNGRYVDGVGAEPEVKVTFANGEVIFVPVWEEHYSHYTVELLSPSGRLYWGLDGLVWQDTVDDPLIKNYRQLSPSPKTISTEMNRYQWHVADQLSKAMAGKPSSICTGKEAFRTLSAIHEILEMRTQ